MLSVAKQAVKLQFYFCIINSMSIASFAVLLKVVDNVRINQMLKYLLCFYGCRRVRENFSTAFGFFVEEGRGNLLTLESRFTMKLNI